MKEEIIDSLKEISGADWVVSDLSQMGSYLYDETEAKLRPTACEDCVVVKPSSAEEIAKIVTYANKELVPIMVRGGGTGIVAGAIPLKPSIVVSLERLNKNIEIDEDNLMITVDAGVTLEELMAKLADNEKLFFPIHPGDEGAQIGGMIVTNAGGVNAVRHGIMRQHVKALEVVLPTGELVKLGGKLIKNNMGFDLMQLMIGGEGALGIVTKATLKLYPKSKYSGTLVISFDTKEEAASFVPKILQEGIVPLAIEYIERPIALEVAKHLGKTWPAKKGNVDIMIILNEATEDILYGKCEELVSLSEKYRAVDSLIAETTKDQRNILEIRSNVLTAYQETIAEGLDIAVPTSFVPNIIDDLNRIAKKYGTYTLCNGHIGDGNIHNFVFLEDGKVPDYIDDMRAEFYAAALSYGGTCTAEHGTGRLRKQYMSLQFGEREIAIMQGIKKVFDPNGILNSGVIVD
ncbi:FAD-binding oxidoreductase [Clostridium sp. PL3]|uniref:FAD-binding oxidoreductase n=1 Tax=Clostridium thailandense TaxID=2794346 RepID=A0A949TSJ6_9CLOT|nr:FAD-binding oxidoreductase [Clostridium thailandense]MBV7272576.1 FAD-binding oxidoreductase [Clostridium thailandense]